jgi:hypothetical protein
MKSPAFTAWQKAGSLARPSTVIRSNAMDSPFNDSADPHPVPRIAPHLPEIR